MSEFCNRFSAKQRFIAILILAYFAVLVVLLICYLFSKSEPQKEDITPFIFNGTKATLGSHPWFVAIRTLSGYEPTCGASIVSREWVLTAEHCGVYLFIINVTKVDSTVKRDKNQVLIAGMINVLYETSGTLHNIVSVHVPPQKGDELNDIALIRVTPPFEYRSYREKYENAIAPIALPEPGMPLNEDHGVVVGNGRANVWSSSKAEFLMTLEVKLVAYEECSYAWNRYRINNELYICVGDIKMEHAVCKGDSGGPLIVMRNNTPTLVGVMSHGQSQMITGCSSSIPFAACTSVVYFRDWITEVFVNNSVTIN